MIIASGDMLHTFKVLNYEALYFTSTIFHFKISLSQKYASQRGKNLSNSL